MDWCHLVFWFLKICKCLFGNWKWGTQLGILGKCFKCLGCFMHNLAWKCWIFCSCEFEIFKFLKSLRAPGSFFPFFEGQVKFSEVWAARDKFWQTSKCEKLWVREKFASKFSCPFGTFRQFWVQGAESHVCSRCHRLYVLIGKGTNYFRAWYTHIHRASKRGDRIAAPDLWKRFTKCSLQHS